MCWLGCQLVVELLIDKKCTQNLINIFLKLNWITWGILTNSKLQRWSRKRGSNRRSQSVTSLCQLLLGIVPAFPSTPFLPCAPQRLCSRSTDPRLRFVSFCRNCPTQPGHTVWSKTGWWAFWPKSLSSTRTSASSLATSSGSCCSSVSRASFSGVSGWPRTDITCRHKNHFNQQPVWPLHRWGQL